MRILAWVCSFDSFPLLDSFSWIRNHSVPFRICFIGVGISALIRWELGMLLRRRRLLYLGDELSVIGVIVGLDFSTASGSADPWPIVAQIGQHWAIVHFYNAENLNFHIHLTRFSNPSNVAQSFVPVQQISIIPGSTHEVHSHHLQRFAGHLSIQHCFRRLTLSMFVCCRLSLWVSVENRLRFVSVDRVWRSLGGQDSVWSWLALITCCFWFWIVEDGFADCCCRDSHLISWTSGAFTYQRSESVVLSSFLWFGLGDCTWPALRQSLLRPPALAFPRRPVCSDTFYSCLSNPPATASSHPHSSNQTAPYPSEFAHPANSPARAENGHKTPATVYFWLFSDTKYSHSANKGHPCLYIVPTSSQPDSEILYASSTGVIKQQRLC